MYVGIFGYNLFNYNISIIIMWAYISNLIILAIYL